MVRARAELAPAARAAQRLALFGGSFDPPHLGHLEMSRAAKRGRDLDHVLWVPAARPPHKPERSLASGVERCDMLELLLEHERDASIWTIELERSGPSYTIDTLRELRSSVHRGTELFLILGSDNLEGFPRWRDVRGVLDLATPIVLPRVGGERTFDAFPPDLRERMHGTALDCERVDASSSDVRARIEAGAEPSALRDALPERLVEYIFERGVYGPA